MHAKTHGTNQPPAEPAPETAGRTIRWAHRYDLLVGPLLGPNSGFRRQTVQLAQVKPGDRVLDVGCGTGDLALAAQRLVGSTRGVHGIDPSPEMIAVARGKAGKRGQALDFQVGLIERIPFPDASFDVVLSSLMMHHLPDELKRAGLQEIRRVLAPGGRLMIVDFKRPTSALARAAVTLLGHRAMPSGVQDLRPLLNAAGFTEVETGPAGLWIFGYVRAVSE